MDPDLMDLDGMLLDGDLAPPMANGEVLFDAPWQGRVFAMARVLAEAGHYTWDEFRAQLIRQIGEWDRSDAARNPEAEYRYYDHFLAALQALLAGKGILSAAALEDRFRAFGNRVTRAFNETEATWNALTQTEQNIVDHRAACIKAAERAETIANWRKLVKAH